MRPTPTAFAILPFLASAWSFELQLFDNEDFEGRFYESSSFANCTNLPSWGQAKASSLITDECVMFYSEVDCAPTWSMRVIKGSHPNLTEFHRATSNLNNAIKSFHLCNANSGASKVNVDLKNGVGAEGQLLVEYRDLCGCVNVPLYANSQVSSVNNYGNCVKLWKEIDCHGDSAEILGGYGEDADDLNLVNFAYITKSVSGCGDAEECIRLNSTVIRFEISTDPLMVAKMAEPSQLEMTASTVFRNNGSATVSQEYVAKKSMTEVTEITRESSMSQMSKVTSPNAKVEVVGSSSSEWGWWIVHSVRTTITDAYTYEDTTHESENERETYVTEETVEFVASQKIEIEPCSTYTVNSYISVMQNFPLSYAVYAHVSGTKGMKVMNTTELRDRLDGMEWVEDFDNQTIVVKGYGTISADFGVEAVIDGDGEVVPGCRA